ncbi:MAG: cupredoxin domain-containing protein [Candidatus Nitrosopumilus sp. bin_32a]
MKAGLTLLALLVVLSGYFVNESFAEISENHAFLLEGSGFAVTEEIIKISEIDLGLSSQDQSGSTINFLTEDGFITLDDEEFIVSNLKGKFLREGKYIRLNGNIESSSGFDSSINFFGRLVEESKDASIYGFTGRITTTDDTYKVIYTTKLSSLTKIDLVSSKTQESDDLTLHIFRGSASRGIVADQTVQGGGALISEAASKQSADSPLRLRYFSQDRIEVPPGTTITIVNDDVVSHSILSGSKTNDRYVQYIADNRISTGEILPGKSTTITFDELGFYRLYDPNYEWMGIIAYVYPPSDSLVLGQEKTRN